MSPKINFNTTPYPMSAVIMGLQRNGAESLVYYRRWSSSPCFCLSSLTSSPLSASSSSVRSSTSTGKSWLSGTVSGAFIKQNVCVLKAQLYILCIFYLIFTPLYSHKRHCNCPHRDEYICVCLYVCVFTVTLCSSIPRALITLFQLFTLDHWMCIYKDVTKVNTHTFIS